MRLLALMLALAAPVSAIAEPVVVRSGEHVDFSRLVLMFDGTDGWVLGKVDGGYEFRAARRDLQFDLSGIYQFIPRDRIGAVRSPRPGVLFLAVNCDCHADGFDLRKGRVVIDIKDGPATRQSRFERPLPALAASQPVGPAEKTKPLDGEAPGAGTAVALDSQRASVAPNKAKPKQEPVFDSASTQKDKSEAPADGLSIKSESSPSKAPGSSEGTALSNAQDAVPLDPAAFPSPPKPTTLPDRKIENAGKFTFDLGVSERARAFESMVIDQIARAGSQGLIIPKSDFEKEKTSFEDAGHGSSRGDAQSAAAAEQSTRSGDAEGKFDKASHDQQALERQSEAPGSGAVQEGLASDHVRIETAIDRDKVGARQKSLSDDGKTCLPDDRLDVASWGNMTGGRPDIAAYRDNLTDELDRVQPEKALKLAKFYAYLTFGAEARRELQYVGNDVPDREIVESIAEIMDSDAPNLKTGPFSGMETCGTAAALWSLLADPALSPGQHIDADAAILAFTALPEHVKRHLGPRLVDTFRGSGHMEAAEIVRNRMELSGKGGEVGVEVSTARLDAALGHDMQAEKRIESVLSDTDPDSPEALLALVETRLSSKEHVDDGLLTALEAVVFNMQKSDLGRRIQRAIAEAHLARDEFRPARDFALESRGVLDSDEAIDLLRRVYKAAAKKADAETFLRLTLPAPRGLGHDERDRPVRLAISSRLRALGFNEDARNVLGDVGQDSSKDERLLAAQIELTLDRPDQAIAMVERLDRDVASPILARAYQLDGQFDIAREYYRQAGDDAGVARMSLQMADWSRLSPSSDPALGPAAEQLALPAAPATSRTVGPRAQASDLIAASQAERAAFEKLLNGN